MTALLKKLDDELASQPASQNLKFEREDWALFRTVEGLQQKAGVPKSKLIRLVLKELTDNALDEGGQVRVDEMPNGGGYFVEDGGDGIHGPPDVIARLFSIRARWSPPNCYGCRPVERSGTACASSPGPSWRQTAR